MAVYIAYVALGGLGYLLTHRWILAGHESKANRVLGMVVVAIVAVSLFGWDRMTHVGTSTSYAAGRAARIWTLP